jgi:radical SAM superfamily enzyme YgiQ (UPF0313 family)
MGDAEPSWERLLADTAAGAVRKRYTQHAFGTLAGLPPPRRDLIRANRRHYGTVNAVQATRGCPHQCSYCSVAAFHLSCHRTRPVAEVIRELRTLPRELILVDDNLIANPAYARQLFTAMRPLGKRWVSQCSLRLADDPQLLKLAADAGCRGMFIGIETNDGRNLRWVDKAVNREHPLAGRIARIRRSGIGVIAGIMVGLDHDNATVFENTLRLLRSLKIDAVQVNILTPLPGTPLHRQFSRQGRIVDTDLSHYDFRHVVIAPAGMTSAQLQNGADWLYRQFYRLDRILLRALRALARLGPAAAWLALRLNLTYRYDNRREGIVGRNPACRDGRQNAASVLSRGMIG